MRYELIRLAQLLFALGVMFAAFLGGLGLGWYWWRRPASDSAARAAGTLNHEPAANGGPFTPELRDDEVVLSAPIFDTATTPAPDANGGRALGPRAELVLDAGVAESLGAQGPVPDGGRRRTDPPPVFAAEEDPASSTGNGTFGGNGSGSGQA